MVLNEMVTVISRISFGAIATFMAILYWSHTRDTAWMLIIIAVIIHYGQIMYSIFIKFGILGSDFFIIPGLLDIGTLLSVLPLIFISIAFIVLMVRYNRG
ncbi:MAG: hypothetical protein L3J12_02910 [Spirochaetales bacterium]|nr:hypothetical protein [Spirochaetales bacterium]